MRSETSISMGHDHGPALASRPAPARLPRLQGGNVLRRLWSDGRPPFRSIWTDPPYGVNYGEKTAWMHRRLAQKRRKPIENDDLGPEQIAALFSTALASALPYAQPGAALYATVPAGTLLPVFIAAMQRGGVSYRHSLVWVKQALVLGRADYHYRHEHILYGWIENGPHYFIDDRSQDSVFEIDRPIDSPLHPTTKPVELDSLGALVAQRFDYYGEGGRGRLG